MGHMEGAPTHFSPDVKNHHETAVKSLDVQDWSLQLMLATALYVREHPELQGVDIMHPLNLEADLRRAIMARWGTGLKEGDAPNHIFGDFKDEHEDLTVECTPHAIEALLETVLPKSPVTH